MAISSTTEQKPAGQSMRARARQSGSAASRPKPNPGATADWMKSGDKAIAGHEDHQKLLKQRREERQAEMSVPWRHWLGKGERVDAIILDNDFGPGLYEHDLTLNDRFKRINPRNGRPFDQFVTSPCQFETDPLTQECGLNPYYATFLTLAVLRPYTNKDGQTKTYQRRLVALKGDAMEQMALIREQQIKAGHTDNPLRGVHVVFARGNGDTALKTGLPTFIERHSEEEIMESFGHPQIVAKEGNRAGQVIKVENEDCFPVDYARAFPKPSAEAIRAKYNLPENSVAGGAGYGSGQFNDTPDGGGGWDNGADNNTEGFNDGEAGGDAGNAGGGSGGGSNNGFGDDLDDDIPF